MQFHLSIGSSLLVILATQYATVHAQIRLCGSKLADMLDFVCEGRGFYVPERTASPSLMKRSWRLSRFLGMSHGRPQETFQVRRRNVADECCAKECTLKDMGNYCADGPSIFDPLPHAFQTLATTPPPKVYHPHRQTQSFKTPLLGRMPNKLKSAKYWFFITPTRRTRIPLYGKRDLRTQGLTGNEIYARGNNVFDRKTTPFVRPTNFL